MHAHNPRQLASDNYLNLPKESADLLKELNDGFFNQHLKTSPIALTSITSVIIHKEAKLSLYERDKEGSFCKKAEEILRPDHGAYAQTKQISHISLYIFEILVNTELTKEAKIEQMVQYQRKLLSIDSTLKVTDIATSHQDIILKQSIKVLSDLLSNKDVKNEKQIYKNYLQAIHGSLEFNKQVATEDQLNSLNNITKKWITNGLDLSTSRVILVAPHGPRPHLVEAQYYLDVFAKLGVPDAENNMVYVVEQLPMHISLITDHDLIYDFLAVSERNKKIGKYFAGDKKMMFSDILAEKGPEILSTLPTPSSAYIGLFQRKQPGQCPMGQKHPSISYPESEGRNMHNTPSSKTLGQNTFV